MCCRNRPLRDNINLNKDFLVKLFKKQNPKPGVDIFLSNGTLFLIPHEWAADSGTLTGLEIYQQPYGDLTDSQLGKLIKDMLKRSAKKLSDMKWEEAKSDIDKRLAKAAGFVDWGSFTENASYTTATLRKDRTFVNSASFDGAPKYSHTFGREPLALQKPSAEELGREVRKALAKYEAGMRG
jgi:hypothetical protein